MATKHTDLIIFPVTLSVNVDIELPNVSNCHQQHEAFILIQKLMCLCVYDRMVAYSVVLFSQITGSWLDQTDTFELKKKLYIIGFIQLLTQKTSLWYEEFISLFVNVNYLFI